MPKSKEPRGQADSPAKNVLQLKVTLRDISPPIWRRVVVPDNFTLGDLHYVIQGAMGWDNCHLHAFRMGGVEYTGTMPDGRVDFGFGPPTKHEDDVLLGQIILRKGQRFTYEYDFGDGWLHEILVEKIEPASQAYRKPVCLAGKRACPPEDCGGAPGYAHVLHVLRSAKTSEEHEFREWVGDYDPEQFDVASVNQRLSGAS
ncbi:MAG TPA: plasmid pRiA4b ORF-3 family protein [Verrucomicrobiae bacterium]|nr:plasmid pRiA4b ORF-3 family protein [Verrucomicrobiae bacterium]